MVTPEQREQAENPLTGSEVLTRLATFPELQLAVVANPSAPEELVDWIIDHGTAEVHRALTGQDRDPVAEYAYQSGDEPELAPDLVTAPRVSRTRARPDSVDMFREEQARRAARDQDRATAESAAAAEAARRAQQQDADEIARRAQELRRWEAAYALAHDGDKPPAGFVPPVAYASAPRTNGLAIAAFIVSLVVNGLIGLILGYVARRQIEERGEGGRGFATAAIVIGWISVASAAIFLIVVLIAFPSAHP